MANVVNVARRGKVMLIVAWTLATLCSVPQVRDYVGNYPYLQGCIIRNCT
jgi:hypothetical protein